MQKNKKKLNGQEVTAALTTVEAEGSKSFAVAAPNNWAVKVTNEPSYLAAADRLQQLKQLQKELEARKEEYITPLRKVLDKLYAMHRDASRRLEEVERGLKEQLERFNAKKTEQAVKKAEKKASKAPNEEMARELVQAAREQDHVPQASGISYRTEYTFEVVDLDAVPVRLNGTVLRPVDEKIVRRLVKASKGAIDIPGVQTSIEKKAVVR